MVYSNIYYNFLHFIQYIQLYKICTDVLCTKFLQKLKNIQRNPYNCLIRKLFFFISPRTRNIHTLLWKKDKSTTVSAQTVQNIESDQYTVHTVHLTKHI